MNSEAGLGSLRLMTGSTGVSRGLSTSAGSNANSIFHSGTNSFPLLGQSIYPSGIITSANQVPLASVGASSAGLVGSGVGNMFVNTPTFNANPLVSVCSDLGEGLPQTIKSKIVNREFVEFGAILAKSEYQGQDEQEFALKVNNAGEIMWKNNQPKVPVSSIHTWTSAFLIFSAVYLRAHPHRTQELLKYCNIVRTAAARHSGFGWRKYDIQFRMRQHIQPHRSWAVIDGELWAMYVQTSGPVVSFGVSNTSNVRGGGSASKFSLATYSHISIKFSCHTFSRKQKSRSLVETSYCLRFML